MEMRLFYFSVINPYNKRQFLIGRLIAATVLIDRVIAGLNVIRLINFIEYYICYSTFATEK